MAPRSRSTCALNVEGGHSLSLLKRHQRKHTVTSKFVFKKHLRHLHYLKEINREMNNKLVLLVFNSALIKGVENDSPASITYKHMKEYTLD
jgi:hypothetical protein